MSPIQGIGACRASRVMLYVYPPLNPNLQVQGPNQHTSGSGSHIPEQPAVKFKGNFFGNDYMDADFPMFPENGVLVLSIRLMWKRGMNTCSDSEDEENDEPADYDLSQPIQRPAYIL